MDERLPGKEAPGPDPPPRSGRGAHRALLYLVLALLVIAGVCIGPSRFGQRQRRAEKDIAQVIAQLVAADAQRVAEGDSSHAALVNFYRARKLRPAWTEGGVPTERARALVRALRAAAAHGLDPDRYHVAALDSLIRVSGAARDSAVDRSWSAGQLDLGLTRAYFGYATDRFAGRFVPERVLPDWVAGRGRTIDLEAHLESALREDRIEESFAALDPPAAEYGKLVAALATYRAIAAAGGWPVVPAGPTLAEGSSGSRVATLRRRLAASGDLDSASLDGERYDRTLADAVRRFQTRSGLRADGRVGGPELLALNVPVEDRIARLEINLERWRWSPEDFGERHVLVNLPEFLLQMRQRDTLVQAIPVVIGQDTTRTPVFDDLITYLVFGPTWRVPPSILRNEILPAARRDRHYLEKRFMRVYEGEAKGSVELRGDSIPWRKLDPDSLDLWVRQDPGPENPLGRVKFMLPNPWDVYLHDSPARGAFSQVDRRASHGCVRVQDPIALAKWLLQDRNPPWDSLAIVAAMDSSRDSIVGLKKAFPVHLVYRTAWVDSIGRVHFRHDVYGYDSLHARAVGRPLEGMSRTR